MAKLEMRNAISQLGRVLSNWTYGHWNLAIGRLKYGCTTRWYGVIYSLGLDKHGVNMLYAYADSSFTHPNSNGGRTVMFNGRTLINTSNKHSIVDKSSTCAKFAIKIAEGAKTAGATSTKATSIKNSKVQEMI